MRKYGYQLLLYSDPINLFLYAYTEILCPTIEFLEVLICCCAICITYVPSGLWHGVSAGILKTVPKYVMAIVVKDFMEDHLPHGDSKDKVSGYNELQDLIYHTIKY